MSLWVNTTARMELRQMIKDTDVSNYVRQQNLVGLKNGSNNIFHVLAQNVVVSSFMLRKNGILLIGGGVGYAISNAGTGEITIAAGTIPVQTDTLVAEYYFQFFTDAEIDEFLVLASRQCGFTDPYLVDTPELIRPAILFLAVGLAYSSLSSFWAQKYSWIIEGRSEQSAEVTTNYLDLSKNAAAEGRKERDMYWQSQGRRYYPAQRSRGWVLPPYHSRR